MSPDYRLTIFHTGHYAWLPSWDTRHTYIICLAMLCHHTRLLWPSIGYFMHITNHAISLVITYWCHWCSPVSAQFGLTPCTTGYYFTGFRPPPRISLASIGWVNNIVIWAHITEFINNWLLYMNSPGYCYATAFTPLDVITCYHSPPLPSISLHAYQFSHVTGSVYYQYWIIIILTLAI